MTETLPADYFASYADIEVHRLMVNDHPRTNAYRDAIFQNKHLFAGKTIMDIGAGTGILSLFAASAGAQRVYAIEASETAALIAAVAAANGFQDVVHVIHCRIEEVTELPGCPNADGKVDVIISEWMGFYLLHESMLESVIFGRDRFIRDDGVMFPSVARIYAAPCELGKLYEEGVAFWDNVYGYDMSSVGRAVWASKASRPEVCDITTEALLCTPLCVRTLNLSSVSVPEVQDWEGDSFVRVEKNGIVSGLCLWFECDFDGKVYSDELDSIIGGVTTLSTAPSAPLTHWKQTVIVLGAVVSEDNECDHESNSGLIGKNTIVLKKSEVENDSAELGKMDSSSDHINDTIVPLANGADTSQSQTQKGPGLHVIPDDVIGWRLKLAQSRVNSRHYDITLELLDPEDTTLHTVPCSCPMARCQIIARMIENEDAQFQ